MTNEEISRAMVGMDSRAKSNTHRLDKLEARQDNLDTLVTVVSNLRKDLEYTTKAVGEIQSDLKLLMSAPRERWETVLSVLITASLSGIVGAVLALILR